MCAVEGGSNGVPVAVVAEASLQRVGQIPLGGTGVTDHAGYSTDPVANPGKAVEIVGMMVESDIERLSGIKPSKPR